MRSANTSLGLNKGTVAIHICLLLLTVASSATILYYNFTYFIHGDFGYKIAISIEYGVETLLQLIIGYICATMATDKRLNCNIVLIQRKAGTYQIHFVRKKSREQ
jgi:hypothetical protein